MCAEKPLPLPVQAAREAGLRYVSDASPGILRKRCGKGFRYIAPGGSAVHDDETIGRIKSLAVPPAWTKVWICLSPRGHLQATGRDAKGRKQSRYHPRWRQVRDETKYERILDFAAALPAIRHRVQHDLALPELPREKVLATIVRLMEVTLIRVGNAEYARDNHSYGLTTMRNHHVRVRGSRMTFNFKGKSGVRHTIDVNNPRLARIVEECHDLPGYELFQYLDDEGNRRTIDSADVNEYLREIGNQDFTAKDFRTWAGTVLACTTLEQIGAFESETQAKKNVVQAIQRVAERLGNTPSVCRKCYVHPAVIDHYLKGKSAKSTEKAATAEELNSLPKEELALIELLRGAK
jgi:DNA topoisomerase I